MFLNKIMENKDETKPSFFWDDMVRDIDLDEIINKHITRVQDVAPLTSYMPVSQNPCNEIPILPMSGVVNVASGYSSRFQTGVVSAFENYEDYRRNISRGYRAKREREKPKRNHPLTSIFK
jgi:hypothetical protein